MIPEYIYLVRYCECIYESGFTTLSAHSTLEGAYKRKNRLMNEESMKYRNQELRYGLSGHKEFLFEAFDIQKIELSK